MVSLILVGLLLGLVYFLVIGNWLAWLAAWAPSFWLAQMIFQQPSDTTFDICFRALWVFLLAGIPCCGWGDLARRDAKRRRFTAAQRSRPYRVYMDLGREDYSDY